METAQNRTGSGEEAVRIYKNIKEASKGRAMKLLTFTCVKLP